MIGHDMDQAIKNRLAGIFSRAESLVWWQHVSERDGKKLDKLLASTSESKNGYLVIFMEAKKTGFYSLV